MVFPIVSSQARMGDQTVFLYKETDSGFEYLDTPAGKFKEGEDPVEAIFRELEEEAGVFPHEVNEATIYHPYLQSSDEKTYLVFPFDIDLNVWPSPASDEHTGTTTSEEELQDLYSDGSLPTWKMQNLLYIREAEKHGKKGLNLGDPPIRIEQDEMPTEEIF